MPLQIVNKSITEIKADAYVNPTDPCFSGSGGTDLAIHTAAGKLLNSECAKLGALGAGETAVTGSYDLGGKGIIHTVGPVWFGGENNEKALLRACYINSLIAASKLEAESVVFPLIASGTFGFPKDKVLRIAIDAISDYFAVNDDDLNVTISIPDKESFITGSEIALREYLNETNSPRFVWSEGEIKLIDGSGVPQHAEQKEDLAEFIKNKTDSLSYTIMILLEKKNMKQSACYKKANITKQTFSKIMSKKNYNPGKTTVVAIAFALGLNLREAEEFIKTAGYSLAGNNTFDRIIEFCFLNGIYDIYEINSSLYKYGQPLLGCFC